jgi:hypothetical protein
MKMRVFLTLLVVAAPAFAQSGPAEDEQRAACTGDALRLCAAYIPDRDKITDCMASRHDQLSAQCRAVFDAGMRNRSSIRMRQ